MNVNKVLLIGGSGFIGGWVANRLSQREIRVTIPTRRYDKTKLGTLVPTVYMADVDVNDEKALAEAMEGMDAVINLAGILHDGDSSKPYGKRFAAVHVELPKKIIAAMKATGVRRLVHMSALKAAPDAPSAYLRSKAAGEAAVLDAAKDVDVTIFRPSVVFGPGDSFLNRFARMLKLFPVLPLGGSSARFQPVFVGDVADAISASLTNSETFGKTYELAGPKVYTLRELVQCTGKMVGKSRPVIALPDGLAYFQAAILSLLPNPPLSPDNLRSMQVDNVTDGHHDFPGWRARSLEAIAPTYLSPVKLRRRMDGYRCRAGR